MRAVRGRDMKHLLFQLGVVLAIAGAGPVLAADPSAKSPDASAKPAKEAKAKEKLICSTQEIAGSLIPKRVCQTQKEIDAQRRAVEDLNSERRELGGTKTEMLG